MSSFVEPSSIVLIIGAICIFLFIMHGLWFSNKPQNRQLKMNNQHDVELSKSKKVAKVRIVGNEPMTNDELQANKSAGKKIVQINDNLGDEYNERQASVNVNPKVKRIQLNDESIASRIQETTIDPNQSLNMQQNELYNTPVPWLESYEIILVAAPERPYLGEEIEDLCNANGLLPGIIEDNKKIFTVYENFEERTDPVFKICSMEPPFCFPVDMHGFKTAALALYMPLPPKGKGCAYFRALRMATDIFLEQLGGQLQDNQYNIITPDRLDQMAAGLEAYDLS